MMMKIPLLVVVGPTASGKTNLSIHLAEKFGGEIVSADSMQIYRGMDIGTAKPNEDEKRGIPHHMVDILDTHQEFSVAEYATMARKKIADIHARGNVPILVGGTGLYVQAIVDNIDFADIPSDDSLREKLRQMAKTEGNQALWEQLHAVDSALAATLHPNNLGRVIRGIEVYTLTNKPLSVWQKESREHPSPYDECMIGLNFDHRVALYARIDQRVDKMLAQGLLNEAEWFYNQEISLTARQAIGYKEIKEYLQGIKSLTEATEHLKQESRRYAKRQLTWMRKDQRIHWLSIDRYDTISDLLHAADRLVINWLQNKS